MNCVYRRTRYDDPIIDQVIALADKNRKTLGFLPHGAIREQCQNGNAFVCLLEDKLVGYILFSNLKRSYIVKIKHFCILEDFRGKNIGENIFHEFKKTIKDAYYIELSCRDDYHINSFWHRLGFNIAKGREGRAINALSILHQFRYKLQDDFLSILEDSEQRPKIQLDSSIIFSLQLDTKVFEGDNSLLAYWNDVVFCIAQVVYEDIERQENEKIKIASIEKANKFYKLPATCKEFYEALEAIHITFPKITESDRKQLACAIANKINYFVTRDSQLLGFFKDFADKYNLLIQSPAEFYSHFDSIINRERVDSHFQTAQGKLVDIKLNIADMCADYLNHGAGEPKQKFLDKFSKNIHNSALKSILINNEVVGILFYTIDNGIQSIHLLRLRQNKFNIAYDVSSFILRELIQLAAQSSVHLIEINDENVHKKTTLAANDLGFTNNKKITMGYIGRKKDFYDLLIKNYATCIDQDIFVSLNKNDACEDKFYSYELEKRYFPAKFCDVDIPAYIIPINPMWAKDLLTPNVEDQHSLLVSKKSNILLSNNSVYFSAKKQAINIPARVLWYITKSRQAQNSVSRWKGHVIASSYIDEVVIGSKSDIFKKFWRLGVYEWKDINKGSSKTCTAIVFSGTEVFNTKIPYGDVKQSISEHMGKGITPISVVRVTPEVFLSLYKKGFSRERFA